MGKILIVRGGAIGDFLLTIPAIQLLRESLPDPHIEVLGYRNVADVATAFGIVEGARSIEYGPMARFFVPNSDLDTGLTNYIGQFDLVLSYLFDPDEYFKNNIKRCGVETFIQGPHQVKDDRALGHAALQLARPLEGLAMFLENHAPVFDFSKARPLESSAVLGKLTAREERPLIALHPGSGSPSKNWDIVRWVEVCEGLRSQYPAAAFAVITGEAEDQRMDVFQRLFAEAGLPHISIHAAPLPEVAHALRRCDLFLGHDSGVSHLAGAVGIPAVVLFGPTVHEIWAPKNPEVHVIPSPTFAMDGIQPDLVIAAASEKLARKFR
ncbi:MAG: glycosyltransferase family 9 protein [Verrucomicrobiae bacterium]|nr:glycosyltransferase family 9 protein [Verrucomicrobiae bacterium]